MNYLLQFIKQDFYYLLWSCVIVSLASLASLTSLKGKLYGKEKFDTVYDFIVDYSHYLLSELIIYNFLNWQGFNSFKNVWLSPQLLSYFYFRIAFMTMELLKWNKESCISKNVVHAL